VRERLSVYQLITVNPTVAAVVKQIARGIPRESPLVWTLFLESWKQQPWDGPVTTDSKDEARVFIATVTNPHIASNVKTSYQSVNIASDVWIGMVSILQIHTL